MCEIFVQIFLDVNLSLNQTLLTFFLYMRQTWIDSGIYICHGLGHGHVTHMHGLAVYVKEGLPFARDLS